MTYHQVLPVVHAGIVHHRVSLRTSDIKASSGRQSPTGFFIQWYFVGYQITQQSPQHVAHVAE